MNVKPYLTALAALTLASATHAQTRYTLIDLTPSATAATAGSLYQGQLGGSVLNRATLWGSDGTRLDLHPSFLDSAATAGRSVLQGQDAGIQVGYGIGASTLNRPAPLYWSGSAASATLLPTTADTYSAQATAVGDGQIVGTLQTFTTRRESVQIAEPHAVLWDIASNTLTDLDTGGNGSYATGVGGGKQVGYVLRGTAVAVMWSGSARSMVSLHPPKGFDISVASATDGISQVGYGGVDVQVFVEKRGRRVRFNYAMLWSGTAASFQVLPTGAFRDTYATGVRGTTLCGYGTIGVPTGAISSYHAVAWTGASHDIVDLHQFVPAGFASSRATTVDAQGNIAGTITTTSGVTHAVVWVPVAP